MEEITETPPSAKSQSSHPLIINVQGIHGYVVR